MVKDFLVGWITFIQDEVEALAQARKAWKTLFFLQPAPLQARRHEQLDSVLSVLNDASGYISVNIGRPNMLNPFVPSVRYADFRCNNFTLGRLHAAILDFDHIYETMPLSMRRDPVNMAAHAEVREALHSLHRHVKWVVDWENAHHE